MHFYGIWSRIMRSALFITNDENLMNRIQIMVHDEAAQLFYAKTIDDAVSIMDEQEIAVVFMPYGLDVLSGDEMIEIIQDHNAKAQIILLFEDEDLLKVIHAHNRYHLCKLISTSNMKLEELPHKLDRAFERYNKDDDLKEFEKDYRLKEDKYKSALDESSSLLNARMNSYKEISAFFVSLLNLEFANSRTSEETEAFDTYFSGIMQEYTNLFLIKNLDPAIYLQNIVSECHKPDQHRFLVLHGEYKDALPKDTQQKLLFLIGILSRFFTTFADRYRGKIETQEADTESGIILNIVYEAIVKPALADLFEHVLPVNENLVKHFSDRAACGRKERIIQYKMIYRLPNEQKE